MQNQKILVIEVVISILLWATIVTIANTIIGNLPTFWGGAIAGFLGTIYISMLSLYLCIENTLKHTVQFILLQIVPLVLIGLWFDLMTALIIAFTLILGIQTLFKTTRDINESASDHIRFRVKTVILPHTKKIIIWLMLLTSVFIYGNTIRTNPDGILLEESFVGNQVQAWLPIIQEIIPDFDPNISVENYVSEQLDSQIESQNLDTRLINREGLIQNQISNLSDRFKIPINRDTPVIQAFITYINKFISPWMSGPLWGIIVSLGVFLTFLPFVGAFQIGIKLITNLIKYWSIKTNLVKFSVESTEKETLIL
ncbi:MAG: hypothetical protein WD512_02610 [Candidatus Paceibacterota bacterium]